MSHFNISLIVRAKLQDSVHKPQCFKRRERRAKADQTKVLLLTSQAPYRRPHQLTTRHPYSRRNLYLLPPPPQCRVLLPHWMDVSDVYSSHGVSQMQKLDLCRESGASKVSCAKSGASQNIQFLACFVHCHGFCLSVCYVPGFIPLHFSQFSCKVEACITWYVSQTVTQTFTREIVTSEGITALGKKNFLISNCFE